MRLWTFQSHQAISNLTEKNILQASWSHPGYTSYWQVAYEWMRDEMEAQGISCEGNAPIWAWHSCGQYEKGPSLKDASMLLSQHELEQGIMTIEFECPDELALLTTYSAWNDIIHLTIDELEATGEANASRIPPKVLERLYDIGPETLGENDSIQACLPFLKKEWIIDIRPLKLGPDQEEFDEHELV